MALWDVIHGVFVAVVLVATVVFKSVSLPVAEGDCVSSYTVHDYEMELSDED